MSTLIDCQKLRNHEWCVLFKNKKFLQKLITKHNKTNVEWIHILFSALIILTFFCITTTSIVKSTNCATKHKTYNYVVSLLSVRWRSLLRIIVSKRFQNIIIHCKCRNATYLLLKYKLNVNRYQLCPAHVWRSRRQSRRAK